MNIAEQLKDAELFDTHAHLNFKPLAGDLDNVIGRARDNGVTRIVAIGAGDGLGSNDEALKIARSHRNIRATVGLHPHDASELDERGLDKLAKTACNPEVVGWGEIGLDFHHDRSPRDVQKKAFIMQLEKAKELGLPVIIHDREAHAEVAEILEKYFPPRKSGSKIAGIMHCFSGDAALARRMVEMGFLISISGVVTFRNAKNIIEVVRRLPVEKMVLETDCPFLAPEPYRGKTNEPAHVIYTAKKVAELKELALEDVARVTTSNAMECFGVAGEPPSAPLAYRLRGNLYLNITSRCNNACSFCPKHTSGLVKGHYLLLEREPSAEEVIEAIGDPSPYPEVVFVGLGEPTLRLDVLKKVAKWLKERGARVRLDTDGQANLVHGRDITGELKGLVDAVSVSLNAADAETYARLCRPARGKEAYGAVLDFIRAVKKNIPEVTATVVGIPGLDVEAARKVAQRLGVNFRVRAYNEPGSP